MLAHAPINRHLPASHRRPVVIHFPDKIVRRYAGGNGRDFFRKTFPLGHGNSGITGISPFLSKIRTPVNRILALEVRQHRIEGTFAGIQRCTRSLDHVVAQCIAHTLRCKLVGIKTACAWMLSDFLVHQRLSQCGCVLLVVPQLAKADDVHHHVLLEFHTEFKCQLRSQHDGFRIISIDVQYRGLNHFDDVGAIQGRATVAWIAGSKTDLVIDHQMDCAAREITPRFSQRKRFHDDALPGKRSVAMYQHGQYLQALGVCAAIHAGANRALHYRVHNFQVRRVKRQ